MLVPEFLSLSPLTQSGFPLVVADSLKSMLYLYQNIFCCCTEYILIVHIIFLRSIPTLGELLTVAVRWLRTFANILWAPEWHFQCNFENGQVNVWSRHKALRLANIRFSCSRMLFFVMTYWKNFQLLGTLPPDPYQGLCAQTPTSFSSFFTFPQTHVWSFICNVYTFLTSHRLVN